LWHPIVEILTDPGIYRSHKEGALRRIVGSPSSVSESARSKLSVGLPGLLLSEGALFDVGPTPYPRGLAAAAALEIIDPFQLMTNVGQWISSSSARSRLDAVAVLGAIPARSRPEWAIQMLLAMTFDNDADVQADAIQVLAGAYSQAGAIQAAIVDRTNDLLARDGTWLLRKVLAELKSKESVELRNALRGRLDGLARHPDLRVRRAAEEVWGSEPGR
jgi:hypothetical protein